MSAPENDVVSELIDEVEEFLGVDGFFCLYEFSWTVRGRKLGLTEGQIEAICQLAYDAVRQRNDLKLVWLAWPTDPDQVIDAPRGQSRSTSTSTPRRTPRRRCWR